MLENKVKRALKRGEAVFGVGLTAPIGVPTLRMLANGQVEWLFIDMEHGSADISDLLTDVQVADLLGLCSVMRIPDLQYHWVARSLDVGALSVMVPRVETREQAEYTVRCAKFPPLGQRGMGSPSFLGYAPVAAPEALRISNEETMVVLQIETAEGVRNVEAIAAVPHVDALFIGPLDLSISLGRPGDITNPEYVSHAESIISAARGRGLAVGIVAGPATIRPWYDRGVRLFSVGSVLGFVRNGVDAARTEFNRQLC